LGKRDGRVFQKANFGLGYTWGSKGIFSIFGEMVFFPAERLV